jgi:uncharacterized phage-associated protein
MPQPKSKAKTTPKAQLTAKDVAEYFLTLVDEDAGDLMTNMKLQKLLYYAQGVHLALYGQPLFQDKIEAWTHGPVVPSVYHEYKKYASGALPRPKEINLDRFSKEQQEVLNEVYQVYGQFSAFILRNMTHDEPPWKDTQDGEVISHEAMKKYFKTRLIENVTEG